MGIKKMGQAKNRGSYEDRLTESMNRKRDDLKKATLKILQGHYEHVPNQFSNNQNYQNGCVIVLDSNEAMDISIDDLIEDGYPHPEFLSEFLDVSIEDDETGTENIEDMAEIIVEDIGTNLIFYRFKDDSKLETLEDVLRAVNKFSFWSPIYIMLNGKWYNTYDIGAVDSEGKTVGIRF